MSEKLDLLQLDKEFGISPVMRRNWQARTEHDPLFIKQLEEKSKLVVFWATTFMPILFLFLCLIMVLMMSEEIGVIFGAFLLFVLVCLPAAPFVFSRRYFHGPTDEMKQSADEFADALATAAGVWLMTPQAIATLGEKELQARAVTRLMELAAKVKKENQNPQESLDDTARLEFKAAHAAFRDLGLVEEKRDRFF